MLILPAVDAMTGWFIQYVLIFVLQTKDTKTKKKRKVLIGLTFFYRPI